MNSGFEKILNDPHPTFNAKFSKNDKNEVPIKITTKNKFKKSNPKIAGLFFDEHFQQHSVNEIKSFYAIVNGLQLFIPHKTKSCKSIPMITFHDIKTIKQITRQYQEGGERAWTINHNKSKNIYRTNDQWIVFGTINEGPACLTIFFSGKNSGAVFYLTPQPRFNILRPIAKSFNQFITRLTDNPIRLLQLVRSDFSIRKEDGFNYAYEPIEYFSGLA